MYLYMTGVEIVCWGVLSSACWRLLTSASTGAARIVRIVTLEAAAGNYRSPSGVERERTWLRFTGSQSHVLVQRVFSGPSAGSFFIPSE